MIGFRFRACSKSRPVWLQMPIFTIFAHTCRFLSQALISPAAGKCECFPVAPDDPSPNVAVSRLWSIGQAIPCRIWNNNPQPFARFGRLNPVLTGARIDDWS